MSDQDQNLPVAIAKLDGRLQGFDGRLERQEKSCERRASSHIDRDLYLSERQAMLDMISEVRTAVAGLGADVKETRREDVRTRRWVFSIGVTVVLAIVTTIVTVLT